MSVLIRNTLLSNEEIQIEINSVKWFHRIEIVPGIVTPGIVPSEGVYDAASYVDSLRLGDLSGLRILELGTWDGPVAFELAQRGANVVASDIQVPSQTGFNVLKRISAIEIPYVQCSVYELGDIFKEEFDIILFFGVFYHLKHPFLAFSNCARALKMGGVIFTEGEAMGHHLEDMDGIPLAIPEYVIGMLDWLDDQGVPMSLSYPGTYKGGENWVLPNRACLKGWMSNAGLEPEAIYTINTGGGRRIGTRGVKVMEAERLEHSLVGVEGGYSGIIKA